MNLFAAIEAWPKLRHQSFELSYQDHQHFWEQRYNQENRQKLRCIERYKEHETDCEEYSCDKRRPQEN